MKKIIFPVLFLLIFINIKSKSAEIDTLSTQYLIGFYPVNIIAQGIKFELEQRKVSKKFSYCISPEFYFGDINDAKDNILLNANKNEVSILGFGASISAKYYVNGLFKKDPNDIALLKNSNLYFICNLDYGNYTLDYKDKSWVKNIENGIEVYTLEDVSQQSKINKFALSFGIGNNLFFGDSFFMDVVMYARINKASIKYNSVENNPYKDDYFSKNGNFLVFQFKFGLLLE